MSTRRAYQPANTYPTLRAGGGRLRFHHTMCRTDGGPGVRPGVCRKCTQDSEHAYEVALTELDRRANRGR